MSDAYSKYSEDFKQIVIKQIENGRRYADVARQYNIAPPNIRYWYKKHLEEKNKNSKNTNTNQ